jgi:adenine deaminase
MRIFIREGSVARNLDALLPLIDAGNHRWFCFCTDDRRLSDLVDEGSIDVMVRTAIAAGLDPVTAIRIATINTAEHFGLRDRGMIAPGRRADMMIFDDLRAPRPDLVFCGGEPVARDGAFTGSVASAAGIDPAVTGTIRIDWSGVDFGIRAGSGRIRVIGIIADQLLTEELTMEPLVRGGQAVADPSRDLLKICVIERHRKSGRMGHGFVRGMGLKRGAIAGTVAHDHHNLIVIGADDRSMMTAARAVAEAGGGQAVADGDRVSALLPLPIAGLMSDHTVEEVYREGMLLMDAVRELGSPPSDPFMTMSFLGLEVIPSLKLTDLGLVDVGPQKVVPLLVG